MAEPTLNIEETFEAPLEGGGGNPGYTGMLLRLLSDEPDSPDSGFVRLYYFGNLLYVKNSAGTVSLVNKLTSGLASEKPAAGTEGLFYLETDTLKQFYDNGTTWDEITLEPAAHASSHENDGSDEISIEGLSGQAADAQIPLSHLSSHYWDGSDPIDIRYLTGYPTDDTKWLRGDNEFHEITITKDQVSDISDITDEITEIQNELGTDPAGAYATVKAWLTALAADLASVSVSIPGICNGRLTLSSGNPVPAVDVSAAATLYFSPYKGNLISLYDGSDWVLHEFTQLSVSLAGLTANKNYDVYVYNNSGALTLSLTAWTNDSTRATALTTQDGVHVKTGATGYRWLGTIRINSSGGQCEDTEIQRYVYNHYNQVSRCAKKTNNTTHTYNNTTDRAWNNDTSQKIELVNGDPITFVIGFYGVIKSDTDGNGVRVGLGIDASAHTAYCTIRSDVANYITGSLAYSSVLSAGYHYVAILEDIITAGATLTAANFLINGCFMC